MTRPLTLRDIQIAADRAKHTKDVKVHWKSSIYEVRSWSNGHHVVCTQNDSAIGLTHQDGVTLNGKLDDFYIVITRHAYLDTHSEAGSPTKYEINVADITGVNSWTNSYGNPTFMIYTTEAETGKSHTYLCVDDYGAMNDIGHIYRNTVNRRKDL